MSAGQPEPDLRVRARLLQIIAALEGAGGTPISNRDLHAFAYLTNVLSPVWEVEPLERSVLKDRDGPRSSALEHELDLCVGAGLIVVDALKPDPENPLRLDATYRLNARAVRPVLAAISILPDQENISAYLNELAFAFLEISPNQRDDAALQDATWSNPAIADGRIVDFGERLKKSINPTYNAAETFQTFAPEGVTLNKAEKLLMYVRLLKRRSHG
jgi:hypothetical protein